MNDVEWVPPTGIALEVHKWLHERVKAVLEKYSHCTPRDFAERCSVISVCKAFQHIDPRELVVVLRSLIECGLVMEYQFDGLPCFIPFTYCFVDVVTKRPLIQSDIDNG